MTPQQANLAPCPFCGESNIHNSSCWFELRDIGASRRTLNAAWNRRAPAPTEPAAYMCPNDPDAASAFKWPKAGANLGCGSCTTECVPLYRHAEPAVDRDAVLEHAALTCEEIAIRWHSKETPYAAGMKGGAFDCAAEIRALKRATPASPAVHGEVG